MMRGLWDRETVALLLIAAMGPLAAIWLWTEGGEALGRLLFVLALCAAWQGLFMVIRAQPPSLAGVVTALAIAVLAPTELGPVQLALGVSFGVVMAEQAFGGWGRNVVNPATVALAFLAFGFPAAPWPDIGVQIGWASWAALAVGVGLGVLSADLVASAVLVLLGARLLGMDLTEAQPALFVCLALLVADPVTSAATRLGRWLYGAGYAALALLFVAAWDAHPVQIGVSAALLASLAAPLLDEIAIALWLNQRRRRFD
jgi:Na+-transporting NADH:ubiquinone oxidoreductase subunit B